MIRFSRFFAIWHHFCVILSFLLYLNAKKLHHLANCSLWRKLYSTSQLLTCWSLLFIFYCIFANVEICVFALFHLMWFFKLVFLTNQNQVFDQILAWNAKKEAQFCQNSSKVVKILQKLQKICKKYPRSYT